MGFMFLSSFPIPDGAVPPPKLWEVLVPCSVVSICMRYICGVVGAAFALGQPRQTVTPLTIAVTGSEKV